MVMTAGEMRGLLSGVGLLTGTITVSQWDGSAWQPITGWTGQAATIAGKGVDKTAVIPAAQTSRPNLTVPLKATLSSPGIPAGPYAARFWSDVGSQGLVWKVGLRRLGGAGGDQWTVLKESSDGITAASEVSLGVITAYKAPPVDPRLLTADGDIQVQRNRDAMLIPPPSGLALRQGLILQSVADPTLRYRLMTVDLLDELDDTSSPYWLEVAVEPT